MTNKTFHRKAHKTETPEQGFTVWETRKHTLKNQEIIKTDKYRRRPSARVRKSNRSELLCNTHDNYKTDTVLYIYTPTSLTHIKTAIKPVKYIPWKMSLCQIMLILIFSYNRKLTVDCKICISLLRSPTALSEAASCLFIFSSTEDMPSFCKECNLLLWNNENNIVTSYYI